MNPSRADVFGRTRLEEIGHARRTLPPYGLGFAVTFFCFLDSEHLRTAHMEPLDAETLEEARLAAGRLLKHHRSARAARIYLDAVEVAILAADGERA